MSLTEQVEQVRTARKRHIDSTITRIRELLFLFPADLNLPRQLEEVQAMKEAFAARVDPNVIHLEELKEIHAAKYSVRR